MDNSDIFDAFYLEKLNNENLDNSLEKINKLNNDIKDIVEKSFKNGFAEGEKIGRTNESLTIRAKIAGKLFSKTNLNDNEIYEIIGFSESKWVEYIKYFREQYYKGVNEGSKNRY